MFTGIIQETGEIESIAVKGKKARIRSKAPGLAKEVKKGDSVSVSGVCLTAVEILPGSLEFDAVTTTLDRTSLKGLSRGSKVNLEPALRFGDPVGGHLVSGHVDCVGTVKTVKRLTGETRFKIGAPDEVMQYLVERVSVAVDGISLTVAKLFKDAFEVAVIPHTLSSTTLAQAKAGDTVNLEGDMMGRWVEKHLQRMQKGGKLTFDKLRNEGF